MGDKNPPPSPLDKALAFEFLDRDGDTGPPDAQHHGEKFVC